MRHMAAAVDVFVLVAACSVGTAVAQDPVSVRTEQLALRIDPAAGTLALQVLDSDGGVVHTTPAPGFHVEGVLQRDYAVRRDGRTLRLRNRTVELAVEPLDARSIAATWTLRKDAGRTLELHLLSDDETRYYGTGERFNALDQRGYILPNVTDDRYGNKGVGTHKPVPFFMSNHGLGVWVDTDAPGLLDLSGSARFLTRLRFDESKLRVVFMGGDDPAAVIEAFTAHTGRPKVPPPWAFGFWKSRDVHRSQDEVVEDIELPRRHGIPASVIVLDSPWATGYNTFEINRTQFPDPEAMFARLEEQGYRLCLWLTPFINHRNLIDAEGIDEVSSNYAEAVRLGHLVRDAKGEVASSEWWKGEGGLVDFTDPTAVAWWHAQLRKTKDYGAHCFKADDGEGNFVPDAVFHDGTPAWRMKNRYVALYNRSLQDYIERELDGDGVLIVRSGYTGVQRTPFAWAGDNEGNFSFADGLPSVVIAGQNAALSGIPLWGSDIAGYAGRATPEVFVRWAQFSAFTPLMQVHMTSNLGPWDFGEQALAIFRDFAVLRLRLFPYLYQAVHEAAASGLPVIRPMALAYPEDPAAHAHVHQYLFGPDLLVAPVIDAGTRRAVYLPPGRWTDFWSGTCHDGARVIEVEAPLERIPLFVREGAILPLLPDDVQTLVPRHVRMAPEIRALDQRRVVEVWPSDDGRLAETWDGLRAELGAGALTIASAQPRPLELRLRHREVVEVDAPGAEVVRTEDGTTVIRYARLDGAAKVRWKEPTP